MNKTNPFIIAMPTLAILVILVILTTGCQNTTPMQRLTLAENLYNSTEESITKLKVAGQIPPSDSAAIIASVHAARAAINTAYAHQSDSTFTTAVQAAEQAVNAFVASYTQAKQASSHTAPQSTTGPATGSTTRPAGP